jgi:Tol biopolymer transport system component
MDGNPDIYIMNAEGSGVIRLTNTQAVDTAAGWSPDGKRILFYSNRDGNWEIYVMNADGSAQMNLSNNPASDNAPAFSPDGKKTAFRSDRDGHWQLYVMNSEGSGQKDLSNGAADDNFFWWSPDGWQIYLVSALRQNPSKLEWSASTLNIDGLGEKPFPFVGYNVNWRP